VQGNNQCASNGSSSTLPLLLLLLLLFELPKVSPSSTGCHLVG
jgi:uncharacterized protein (TIGR03382 family)